MSRADLDFGRPRCRFWNVGMHNNYAVKMLAAHALLQLRRVTGTLHLNR
jgi:hypothetical protein